MPGLERDFSSRRAVTTVHEVGDPCGHEATWRDDPSFGVFVGRRNDTVARELAGGPNATVDDDVGDDTCNDTVGDVVTERDDEESQECGNRVSRVVPVDLADTIRLIRHEFCVEGKTR